MTEELTTDDFFLRLYEAGVSRGELIRSELRHLLMRHRAYEQRKRREELHLIGLRNEVRSFAGGDIIEDPYSSATEQDTDKDEAARRAMLHQVDFEDTEEMTADDASSLQ